MNYATLNSIVDGGGLATISNAEAKALIVFLRHADEDGIAFPSAATLGQRIGTTARNAQRLIAGLTQKGFLATIDGGNGGKRPSGQYISAKRQIMCPAATAATGRQLRQPETPSTAATGRQLRQPTSYKQHKQQNREQHRIPAYAGFLNIERL